MGILTHEQRPGDLLARAVLADRLGDRQNMRFVQTRGQRTAAMAAGAEANQLRRVVDVRLTLVIGLLQCRHVDQYIDRRRLAGKWMNRHLLPTPC